jgi:hypothetical protein
MAYTPGFHHDVFVSYARRSDLADWVTQFKDELQRHLASTLGGRPPDVWMDSRLQPADDFREKIQAKLCHTAIFVAVISPRYVESVECMEIEMRFFQKNGTGTFVQILKTPLEEPEQQIPLPNLHYHKFFDHADWGPDEFEPGEMRFSKLVKQVAVQVRGLLIEMRRGRQRIYLTHLDPSSADATLRRLREELRNEFEDRGYSTLPRQILLNGSDDDFTLRNVEQSDVLVHLVNGPIEAAQFQLAVNLRKPTVVCSFRPLLQLNAGEDLPVVLGSNDWKLEVVQRVESKLSARAQGASV